MFLNEMFNTIPTAMQRGEDDNTQLRGLADMRKTRLTLAQINKIRVMDDMRRYEKEKSLEFIKKMYGTPAQEAEPEL